MNDFTKEELNKLAYGLECAGLINSDLRMKVLSMIDNYCEHEYVTFCKTRITNHLLKNVWNVTN